ncbi:MAG: hypothetical protein ABR878_01655 [Roseiarcus sp.]|jgi:hypothetical protein
MAESLEAAVARLDARLTGIEARLDEHYAITRDSRANVDASLAKFEIILTRLVALSNEWGGVRKTLATAGVMIALVSSILGAITTYFRYGSK